MIWPVTVVPTLAPRMMPRDCLKVMRPAATRPEVITIVAVELWMTAVMSRPTRNPATGLLVTFLTSKESISALEDEKSLESLALLYEDLESCFKK